jgi:hypothetical protein
MGHHQSKMIKEFVILNMSLQMKRRKIKIILINNIIKFKVKEKKNYVQSGINKVRKAIKFFKNSPLKS